MKTYEEIAERVLTRKSEYEEKKKQRRKKLLKTIPVATSFCLVAVIAAVLLMTPTGESPHNTDPTATDDSGRLLWADDRTYNNSSVGSTESAYILPWEYRTDPERYFELTFQGNSYRTRYAFATGEGLVGGEISASLLGEKLGSTLATGFDHYTDLPKTALCEVYGIKGIESAYLIAVKFSDTDAYYVFLGDSAEAAPDTFGALCDRYALTETLPFSRYYDYKNGNDAVLYGLTEETSVKVWELLSKCGDAVAVSDGYSSVARDERISFTASSEALGITNKVFAIGADGYLKTNLAEYGYAYFIGESAAAEIIALVRGAGIEYEESEESRYYLTGTITAIGDGYIEVDDSIMMKDPDDGIVFTVSLNDFRVRRYVDCGYLRVGSTVRIEYDGRIYADAPTVIENALAIEKVIVSSDGEVWIPE